jgi:hypothetical protein
MVSDSEIIFTSGDASKNLKGSTQQLCCSVESLFVRGVWNDLELHFSTGLILQTFTDSDDYEHWYFMAGPEEMIVAGPGQLWSSWERQ